MGIFIAIVLVLIIILIIIIALKSVKSSKTLEVKDVPAISIEMIVTFFKQEDIVLELKNNENIVAVAIKDEQDGVYKITCALFNQEKNKIMSKNLIFKSTNIDKDLLDMFGEKSMVVFN